MVHDCLHVLMRNTCLNNVSASVWKRRANIRLTYVAGVVPSATMQSSDGKYVIIGGNGDSVYSRLMAAVGRPDMAASNPLYSTNTHRCQRADQIYKVGRTL